MSSILDRARTHVRDLEPYPPGKPIGELERELGISGAVKLASNESPFGPSPRAVQAAIEAAAGVHRYPDGSCFYLRQALAKHLGVDGHQLLFGTGSDEILGLLAKVFVDPGDEVVFYWPGFAMYPIVTRGMGGVERRVALGSDHRLDVEALLAAVGPATKLVFVANPNNPTGTSLGESELCALLDGIPDSVLVVLDEAYVEYMRRADAPRTLLHLQDRTGLVSLRTFSKIHGLAGLRVGYAVGNPEVIGLLDRARHPFSVSSVAQAAALAALEDRAHLESVRERTWRGIEELERGLRALGLSSVPTDANFVMTEVGEGAVELDRRLQRRGVIVRSLAAFGLDRHIRITAGAPEENARLLEALEAECGR